MKKAVFQKLLWHSHQWEARVIKIQTKSTIFNVKCDIVSQSKACLLGN